jgi:hypothetical protein
MATTYALTTSPADLAGEVAERLERAGGHEVTLGEEERLVIADTIADHTKIGLDEHEGTMLRSILETRIVSVRCDDSLTSAEREMLRTTYEKLLHKIVQLSPRGK